MSKILESTDYGKFVTSDFNRNVIKTKRLELSMKKHGWISAYPAHVKKVNGKYAVKAGHHRVTVAQKLGIPIKFVVCEDEATIHELEQATIPWKPADYVVSHIRIGNPHYTELQGFCDRTGISQTLAASMLYGECAGSGNASKKLKEGSFIVKNRKHAEDVADIVAFMRKHDIEFASIKNMVIALSQMLMVPEFDIKVFKKKVASHAHIMKKPRSLSDALEEIEEVYNRKAGLKTNVAFRAKELSRERKGNLVKQKAV